MKIRIITPHITGEGAVAHGTILDLEDAHAIDYLNAKLAEPITEQTPVETATKPNKKATATSK